MITGIVNRNRQAVIAIELRGPGGQRYLADAVIDTGFNRFLTLPASVIAALGLPQTATEQAELGNGSIELLDLFDALVKWDNIWRAVVVHAAETSPLVGMEMLAGHELRIQVAAGGRVTIEAMP